MDVAQKGRFDTLARSVFVQPSDAWLVCKNWLVHALAGLWHHESWVGSTGQMLDDYPWFHCSWPLSHCCHCCLLWHQISLPGLTILMSSVQTMAVHFHWVSGQTVSWCFQLVQQCIHFDSKTIYGQYNIMSTIGLLIMFAQYNILDTVQVQNCSVTGLQWPSQSYF